MGGEAPGAPLPLCRARGRRRRRARRARGDGEREAVRLRHTRFAGLRVRRAPSRGRRAWCAGDDRRNPRTAGERRARRCLDRDRRSGRRAERRGSVAPSRYRLASRLGAAPLRRDHSGGCGAGVPPGPLRPAARRQAPGRRDRARRSPELVACLVDGKPVTGPIGLPGSSKRWKPIVTAESWTGGARSATASRSGSSTSGSRKASAAHGGSSCRAIASRIGASRSGNCGRPRTARVYSRDDPVLPFAFEAGA